MIRQENIELFSPTREFETLFNPLGNRYLRGLESYLYHKDLPPISEADRLKAKGIPVFGVRPDNVQIQIPADATPEQRYQYMMRTQALQNPRIDTGLKFQPYVSGWATDGVNREMVERNAMGIVYREAKIASKRTQNLIPTIN